MTIGDSLFHKSWGPFLSEDETERIKTQKFKYFFILIRIVGLIVDAMMKFSCWVIVEISFGHLIKIPNIFQPFSLQHSLNPSRLTPPLCIPGVTEKYLNSPMVGALNTQNTQNEEKNMAFTQFSETTFAFCTTENIFIFLHVRRGFSKLNKEFPWQAREETSLNVFKYTSRYVVLLFHMHGKRNPLK